MVKNHAKLYISVLARKTSLAASDIKRVFGRKRRLQVRDILVCGTWRCGSTMVCEDLANTNALGYPQEHMCRWDEDLEAKDWRKEYASVREIATSKNDVFSTKLMGGHMVKIDRNLSTFLPANGMQGILPTLATAFRDPVWVWVYREDVIAQAVSSFVAVKTGTYHLIRGKDGFTLGKASRERPSDLPYDFQQIMRHLNLINRHNVMWANFFSFNDITPLKIRYEDAAQSPVAGIIAQAAQIELPEYNSVRNLRKLSDERSMALKERFVKDLMR